MLWLNAALAFAVTMLILSMVTNVFVETIHRFAGMREKGLALMLGHLFDRVLAQRYPELGGGTATMTEEQRLALATKRELFIDYMTVNRAPTGTALKGDVNRADFRGEKDEPWYLWPWRGRRLDRLEVNGFMARLGSSEFGDLVRANAGEALTEVLKDLAQKFDDFGAEASEFFARRARLLAVAVSIVVAWFMYVQPYEIFRTFIDDPAKAAAVIDLQEGATKDLEAYLERKVAEAKVEFDRAETALTSSTSDNAISAKEDLDNARKAWDDAKLYAVSTKLKLTDAGVPIGWSVERMESAGFYEVNFLGLFKIPWPSWNAPNGLRTAMWLILGGLLVGLGGPFWYDIIKSLSAITALIGGAKGKEEKAEPKPPGGGRDTAQPQNPVDHFETAAKGRDAATGGGAGEVPDDEPVG